MAKDTRKNGRLGSQELSGFCAQVAMMLTSGMPLYEGMEAMAHTYKDTAYGPVYERISKGVTEHGSLYAALKEEPMFPAYLTEMVGIGERTGRSEEVLKGLSGYYARDGRIRGAIRSAVTYPMVLGIMMALIVLVMLWKVLPMFRQVLNGMGVTLSGSGMAMMNLGTTLGWIVFGLVVVVVLIALVCVLLMKTGKRVQLVKMLQKLFPPAARLSRQLSASRVASVLSMMLGGGFPLEEALELVPSVLNDEVAVKEIETVRSRMDGGVSFGEALTSGSLFDELYSCMIRTGCEVGCADQVMARVAADYEEKLEDGIAGLVSVIEPSMVGVLAVVIGCVLLSVMLPMAGIITSIL